ncbi:uncharacterized protein B0H64DRAFT_468915 [Chaetomium fimeti]|uniref:NmrA-like domain-containing protein n=1 Tax=Chaetomium fimeti TaxID=1854472 RepID=A0AAE0LNW3_9PEZI|nr:hypothetical protein B0H64DRAFT_468915 [Chaetomium fimeti]
MSTKPLERVTVIGASGRIGGAFAKALVATGKHTVTALTRAGSASKLPAGVKAVEVDYDDEAALVAALQGQQFLAITLGVAAPEDLHGKIVTAAGKAGVPYVMPNVYGYPQPAAPRPHDMYSGFAIERVRQVVDTGVSSPVTMSSGFWYEWSLALGQQWFGFEIRDRRVTFFDDGRRTVTASTWDQCGRAFAALLSLPETGASPALADFKGGMLLVDSFRVSQRDMLDSLHRVLGTSDADWEILYEPVVKRVQEGIVQMKQGDRHGFAKALYGDIFDATNDASDYAATRKTATQILGLPKEDLDEATKRTVDMVLNDWTPFSDTKM